MRDTFVKTLIEEAKKNKDIELLTGDLGFGVLKPYWEQLPNQFTNAGIAEQNMTSVAAGMALEGRIVFTYSIGNFPTLRCLEQIRNDCAYHHANVKIVCVGGGFVYGSLGMSHHATEDIAIMRALPDVAVICPGDLIEAEAATKAIIEYQGTCYLRLGRGGEKQIHSKLTNFKIGKAIKINENYGLKNKIALFTTGAILDEGCKLFELLKLEDYCVIQYSFPTVKPIDKEVIKVCARECDWIITVEEHNIVGGFGSAVSEVTSEVYHSCRVLKFGINDTYSSIVGSQSYLRDCFGITAAKMFEQINMVLSNE